MPQLSCDVSVSTCAPTPCQSCSQCKSSMGDNGRLVDKASIRPLHFCWHYLFYLLPLLLSITRQCITNISHSLSLSLSSFLLLPPFSPTPIQSNDRSVSVFSCASLSAMGSYDNEEVGTQLLFMLAPRHANSYWSRLQMYQSVTLVFYDVFVM